MFLIVIIQIVFRGVGVVGAGVGELKLIVVTLQMFLALMVHVGEVELGGEAALPGHPLSHLTNERTVLGQSRDQYWPIRGQYLPDYWCC